MFTVKGRNDAGFKRNLAYATPLQPFPATRSNERLLPSNEEGLLSRRVAVQAHLLFLLSVHRQQGQATSREC